MENHPDITAEAIYEERKKSSSYAFNNHRYA